MAFWMGRNEHLCENRMLQEQPNDEFQFKVFAKNRLGEEESRETIPQYFSLAIIY